MRRFLGLAPLLLGLALIAAGLIGGDMDQVRETSTYRNFDVPSEQSGVQYLSPGLVDRANEGEYTFGGPIHTSVFIALGAIFVIFYILRNYRSFDVKLGLQRGMTQWLVFLLARLGMFRVAGAAPVTRCAAGVFPFMNCQACEMATGACPIGQVQGSLLSLRFPALALGTILASAALLGRWICGWLCPFGLFSDMLDRVSLRRFNPSQRWRIGGFAVLGLLVVATLLFAFLGIKGQAPFCSTICASGKVYGLLPYYSTTAASDVGNGAGLSAIIYHGALFLIFLVAAVLVSGRVFCRYVCPCGAALGALNKVAAVQVVHHAQACNDCGRCHEKCPMGIDLAHQDFLTQSACIRCGRCIKICSRGARTWEYPWLRKQSLRMPQHDRVETPPEPVPTG
ncbi:MAG: 4Fe-4S binding protein [Planctomycetota bacterium]